MWLLIFHIYLIKTRKFCYCSENNSLVGWNMTIQWQNYDTLSSLPVTISGERKQHENSINFVPLKKYFTNFKKLSDIHKSNSTWKFITHFYLFCFIPQFASISIASNQHRNLNLTFSATFIFYASEVCTTLI